LHHPTASGKLTLNFDSGNFFLGGHEIFILDFGGVFPVLIAILYDFILFGGK
jgi:hypothetical protein